MRRRYNSRRRGAKRKVLILSIICFLCVITVGYAAFQTNITITAKGNIIDNSFTVEELKEKVTGSGDGLYKDPVEENRYVYKGSDPDNYVTFNGEEGEWRIIAIESDNTLKIRKINSIGDIEYDDGSRYIFSNNMYCSSEDDDDYGGCNVWGSINTMLDANGNNITSMPWSNTATTTRTLPDTEAYMNIYLNTTYYNSLSKEARDLIDTHYWHVGILTNSSTQTLATDIEQERNYLWKGNVGLMSATDYVRASNDSNCTNAYISTLTTTNYCKNDNYIYDTNIVPTLSLSAAVWVGPAKIWYVQYDGNMTSTGLNYVSRTFDTNPVVYIKSDVTITGSGTVGDPYVLK